ncbi:MAG: ATP-binding cassette domain-containing protein [Elusimicrobia bacterium]|nr:ATP-binding cassette domain-containing protein [Elusimicrobiota bacterium]
MMTQPIIGIHNVSFRYPKSPTPALANVSLMVNQGEIFGILGPNGSGKSTLLGLLSTSLAPKEGAITIAGFDLVKDTAAIRILIGVVFQHPALDKKLTIEENLKAQGYLYRLQGRKLQERIEHVLDVTGLSLRRRSLVEKLSGGLMRRAEIAKGLIHHPKILILDEPSTGLDPGARLDLWRHLNELAQTLQTTVVATTHLMDEAEKCSRLALINEGTLIALGTPQELKGQIGGDVITLASADPQGLKKFIAEKFSDNAQIVDQTVRLERAQGHLIIPQIISSYPGTISSATLSKPTLEDVFIHRTGHRFWNQT